MNILEKIIESKRIEVEQKKALIPEAFLKTFPFYETPCRSLGAQLLAPGSSGIIAEFKRKSPSKGIINGEVAIGPVVDAYSRLGACGISILTDEIYFGGTNDDILLAKEIVEVPVLRKDFIIDEYQLTEAKAIGADVILLIAACLSPKRVKELASFAKKIGLEILLEIHNEDELLHICEEVDLVGVNNRDLKTFSVDVNRSIELSQKIPTEKIKISESGIIDAAMIVHLSQHGFKGFLIGETFMKQPDPAIAFADFVNQLKVARNGNEN